MALAVTAKTGCRSGQRSWPRAQRGVQVYLLRLTQLQLVQALLRAVALAVQFPVSVQRQVPVWEPQLPGRAELVREQPQEVPALWALHPERKRS